MSNELCRVVFVILHAAFRRPLGWSAVGGCGLIRLVPQERKGEGEISELPSAGLERIDQAPQSLTSSC